MRFEFVPPDLRRIDELSAELVACAISSDERPFGGLAGLLDWRLSGKLSALARRGFLTGRSRELLLLPGRPRVPFDKVLVLGLGPSDALGEPVFEEALARLTAAVFSMRVKRAVLELPGRARCAVGPERAAELLFQRVREPDRVEAFWIVEDAEAERAMRHKTDEELRRLRLAALAAQENIP